MERPSVGSISKPVNFGLIGDWSIVGWIIRFGHWKGMLDASIESHIEIENLPCQHNCSAYPVFIPLFSAGGHSDKPWTRFPNVLITDLPNGPGNDCKYLWALRVDKTASKVLQNLLQLFFHFCVYILQCPHLLEISYILCPPSASVRCWFSAPMENIGLGTRQPELPCLDSWNTVRVQIY